MRRGGAEAPVTEEPYERIVHLRVCGGAGRATAGPTRNRTAGAAGEWEERSAATPRRACQPASEEMMSNMALEQ